MITSWHKREPTMKRTIITVILTLAFTAFAIQAVEQTAFSGAGIIESKSGGFKFPDGSVQLSAASSSGACTPITYVPYIITVEGVYCFTGNIETSMTTGYAIDIQADNVVIDLNGWKLDGLGAGSATEAIGIYATYWSAGNGGGTDHPENITIRNGTIRGFYYGINTVQFSLGGHLIEYIRAVQNTRVGLYIKGQGSVIRHNQVINTGGTTAAPFSPGQAFGIWAGGSGIRVLDNDIINTVAESVALGMSITLADGAVVQDNRIENVSSSTETTVGINVSGDNESSSVALVVGNKITNVDQGINIRYTADGKYRDNLTFNVSTPFTGGTDAGGND